MFDKIIIIKDLEREHQSRDTWTLLIHVLAEIKLLHHKIDFIMSAQTDAAALLVNIRTQLLKAKDEITTKIQTLIDAAGANSGAIDPALQAAIDDLTPVAQQLDDIVPDAPAPEPTPEPTV